MRLEAFPKLPCGARLIASWNTALVGKAIPMELNGSDATESPAAMMVRAMRRKETMMKMMMMMMIRTKILLYEEMNSFTDVTIPKL